MNICYATASALYKNPSFVPLMFEGGQMFPLFQVLMHFLGDATLTGKRARLGLLRVVSLGAVDETIERSIERQRLFVTKIVRVRERAHACATLTCAVRMYVQIEALKTAMDALPGVATMRACTCVPARVLRAPRCARGSLTCCRRVQRSGRRWRRARGRCAICCHS